MTLQKSKSLALAGIAATSLLASNAQSIMPSTDANDYDERAKIEFQEFARDSHRVTTTFGVDKKGAYAAVPTAIGANVTEVARMYQIDEFTPNGNIHYNALGIRPTFSFGEIKATPLVSANIGDKQDILGGLQLELNNELMFRVEAENNLITDSTRFGTQVHYNPNNLEFTLGYDVKETPGKETMSQVFVSTGIKLNPNNYVRIAGASRHQGNLDQNYFGGLFLHHGKDSTFGFRAFGEAFLDNSGNFMTQGHLAAHTGRTTFGATGARLLLTDSAFDGGYGPYLGDGKLSVSSLEAIPFYLRPGDGGIGADFTWKVNKSNGINSGTYGAGVFAATKAGNWLFGASADITYNFNDRNGNYTSICPAIFARAPKGKLEATLSATFPVGGSAMNTKASPSPTFFGGIQYVF